MGFGKRGRRPKYNGGCAMLVLVFKNGRVPTAALDIRSENPQLSARTYALIHEVREDVLGKPAFMFRVRVLWKFSAGRIRDLIIGN